MFWRGNHSKESSLGTPALSPYYLSSSINSCKGDVFYNFDFATSGTDSFAALAFFFIADWNNIPSNIMHAPSLSSFMSHLLDHECKLYIRCNLRVKSMQFNYYWLWAQLKFYFLTLTLRRTREGGGVGGVVGYHPF